MTTAVVRALDTFGPDRCDTLDYERASAFARDLAASHGENFPVLSRLVPARLRDDFAHIYAFCRWADDLGDEVGSPERALELLAWWRRELDRLYDGQPRHPVFIALARTVETHDLPRQPFDALIDAFEQDQRVSRYDSWQQLLDYCTRSANPVGRLLLMLFGHHDEERAQLADATCTALQLANFWQDVRRDVHERNRVYLPADLAAKHRLDLPLMVKALRMDCHDHGQAGGHGESCACTGGGPNAGLRATLPASREAVMEACNRTQTMFDRGKLLWPMLDREARPSIRAFTWGGEAILAAIRRQGYDTLTRRPALSAPAKARLVARGLASRWLG